MSDLRERLMLVATDFNEWGHIRTPDQVVAALLPIIEAELQKRDRLRDQINDAYVRTEAALTETNKLLEQTIEVLERSAATFNLYMKARRYEADIAADQLLDDIPPLLDNLKAREKGPDAHQQAVKEILAPKPIDHVDGGFKP